MLCCAAVPAALRCMLCCAVFRPLQILCYDRQSDHIWLAVLCCAVFAFFCIVQIPYYDGQFDDARLNVALATCWGVLRCMPCCLLCCAVVAPLLHYAHPVLQPASLVPAGRFLLAQDSGLGMLSCAVVALLADSVL
jgi:hypothetical protein